MKNKKAKQSSLWNSISDRVWVLISLVTVIVLWQLISMTQAGGMVDYVVKGSDEEEFT